MESQLSVLTEILYMHIALTKILEREGSISQSSFYEQLLNN